MSWIDGSKYHGQWLDGVQEGFGVMLCDNGKIRAGFFEKNVYLKPLYSMHELEKVGVPDALKDDIVHYLKKRDDKKKNKKKRSKGKKFLDMSKDVDSEQEDLGVTFKAP